MCVFPSFHYCAHEYLRSAFLHIPFFNSTIYCFYPNICFCQIPKSKTSFFLSFLMLHATRNQSIPKKNCRNFDLCLCRYCLVPFAPPPTIRTANLYCHKSIHKQCPQTTTTTITINEIITTTTPITTNRCLRRLLELRVPLNRNTEESQ